MALRTSARGGPKLYPVIMAGGSGTRFWPLSRIKRPKQFLSLATERPLITETARRLDGLASAKDMFVVCGKVHAPAVKKWVKGLPSSHVLVEPMARNTAPAIALGTAHVAAKDPTGVIAVLPSDHHIANPEAFRERLALAARVAQDGYIVTLGIRPTRPDTGYGYIRVGTQLAAGGAKPGDDAPYRVAAFVEKPDLATAERYVATGDYAWNGGIFVFRADVMMDAFGRYMPEFATALLKISKAIGTRAYAKVLAREFLKMPATSIDYGIAEKATNMVMVSGDFGWSDVGSFAAMPEVRPLDEGGNVVTGKRTFAIDCKDSVVLGGDRILTVVGMTGVVVVDAGDAILVVPKDKSQDVRKAVELLRAKKLTEVL